MSAAQTQHDRLQLFIKAARRGRFDRHFTSADAHCFNLAEAIIDHGAQLTLELLAGAAGFMNVVGHKPDIGNELLGRCQVQLSITPRPIATPQPSKLRRPAK